ncbi:MAG: GntR family transcriptional regulator [Hyphomicrobiaceae bacterium]|nr:GntR family transcriptional regulator [Hyphomicrobiaceae bacterium]
MLAPSGGTPPRVRPGAGGNGRLQVESVPKTLAGRLRMQISDDIVRGQLAPGVVLDEMALARRFHVSRTPVREAIRLLVASGLVEARPHRSAVVARPDKTELVAMFEALQELEALCAGLAAERMTTTGQARLRSLQLQLLGLVRTGDPQRYHEINEEFHSAIYAGAHNAHLEALTLATRARTAPFSRAQFRTLGRLSKSHDEHERIVTAIRSRNREAAVAAMRRHIASVYNAYGVYQSS